MIDRAAVIQEARQDPRWPRGYGHYVWEETAETAVEVALPIILNHLTREVTALYQRSPEGGWDGWTLAVREVLGLLAQPPQEAP